VAEIVVHVRDFLKEQDNKTNNTQQSQLAVKAGDAQQSKQQELRSRGFRPSSA
jgi:hypothetical protein